MKSTKEIMNFQILEKDTGDNIGNVKDIIFTKKSFRISAILISKGRLFKGDKIIRYKKLFNIGKDYIMAENKDIVENLKDFPIIEKDYELGSDIIGLPVIMEEGETLGYISDILFEEKQGRIKGFILTDGIIQDLLDGRNVLPFVDNICLSESALIINKQFKDNFEKNKEKFKKLLEL